MHICVLVNATGPRVMQFSMSRSESGSEMQQTACKIDNCFRG
jgi:hypothetical protein